MRFTEAISEGIDALVASLATIPTEMQDRPFIARLKSENVRWLAARAKPEVYGDRLNLDVRQQVDIATTLIEARKRVSNHLQVLDAPILSQVLTRDRQSLVGSDEDDELAELTR